MRRYTSGDRGYQAITEAMQQIRYGHLYESEEEEMMDEMSDEEEEAVAQMMDEALYEMDMEDDEDNLNEADGGRKARRRRRLRQALLIGAGLAAAAAPLAFAPKGTEYAAAPEGGEGMMGRGLRGAQNLAKRYTAGAGTLGTAAGTGYTAGREKLADLMGIPKRF
jgi:ferric-dicitrate binding protein FerR (iron transport regulator)